MTTKPTLESVKKQDIRRRLIEHLRSSSLATINDCETEALYREAHGLAEDEETVLEDVEQWAISEAMP